MALFDEVKEALRVTHDYTDAEISIFVASALSDMARVGVRDELLVEETMDPLAHAAVLMYCKGTYGFDNDEGARFVELYERTVTGLVNSRRNECDESDYSDDESGDTP